MALDGLPWLQTPGPRLGEGRSWEHGGQREGSDHELEGSAELFQTEGPGTRMGET